MGKMLRGRDKYKVEDIGEGKVLLTNMNKVRNKDLGPFKIVISCVDLDNINLDKLSRKTRGKKSVYGYWQENGKTELVHRWVVGLKSGDGSEDFEVHHHRGYGDIQTSLNNSRSNLFILTKDQHNAVHYTIKEGKKLKYAFECDDANRKILGLKSREEFLKEEKFFEGLCTV
ncbi:hypothetical protein GLW05_20935 [Pontibacillus yanchengensis]|uniref:Uncharacterized protein n=1 Tax=Pontibacillus yanchengensis TaxID=462910 RepID=A0A6I5A6L1_9BACI|nr:hypothetical protein [Pontibacillus yanchengensis]MYL36040.1 hypothetical protein [Pontibacillus yanchengensis]